MPNGWIGGGGGDWASHTPKKKRRKSVEAEICRALGFPYCGFLLYHSGHKRLRYFLENHLEFFDQVSGSKFGIFGLVKEHKHHLVVDQMLASGEVDDEVKGKIRRWQQHVVPFTPDRSFAIAEALGIERQELPTLLLYRAANDYQPFARLNMRDSWFPNGPEDKSRLDATMQWLGKLFDSLDCCAMIETKQDALKCLQTEMDRLARSEKIWRPVFSSLRKGVVPLFKLPFDLVASLSAIVENVGTNLVKQRLEASTTGDEGS